MKARIRISAFLMAFAITLLVSASYVAADSEQGVVRPTKWSVALPADLCPGGVHVNCHGGSPVLADLNGDGYLDVVAVTNNGYVVAIRNNGSLLWQKDIAPNFGMAPGTHEIHSSPAVADIDSDGFPEVVVGAGTIMPTVCTQGGVIVLSHTGQVEAGWPKLAYDHDIPPANCADTIISSPSLGDLDNDGDMEIVASGFDKRVYAWHHDGTLLPGFPPDSFHSIRFPTWPNLYGLLADDVWSSPGLADLDGDGYLDIITGTGEGNFDQRYGGNANGWVCPYQTPPAVGSPGYCGGALYAFNRFGQRLPGYPRYFLESMVSSLAMADVNNDGAYEIFTGFSDYYYVLSPDHPTYGFRLLGLDSQANDLPGWEGGKVMGGVSMMSPAIGDIAGDDGLEVVTLGGDKKLYAWHVNGTPVAGFPMIPRDIHGGTPENFRSFSGLTLADFDGDSKMEIFFSQAWAVTVVDGNGQQISSTSYPGGSAPIFFANGMLVNSPAIGDIDNDGKLELVAANSVAWAWDLDSSSSKADWPMFRNNAVHHARIARNAFVAASPEQLVIHHDYDDTGPVLGSVGVVVPQGGPVNWSASASGDIQISPNSGIAYPGQPALITVSVSDNGLSGGINVVGEIQIEAFAYGEQSEPDYASAYVSVYLGDFSTYNLPIINKQAPQ